METIQPKPCTTLQKFLHVAFLLSSISNQTITSQSKITAYSVAVSLIIHIEAYLQQITDRFPQI